MGLTNKACSFTFRAEREDPRLSERDRLVVALSDADPDRRHYGRERLLHPSERAARREMLLPNVRLANGGFRQEMRRRLVVAFYTPLFPELLIASSPKRVRVGTGQSLRGQDSRATNVSRHQDRWCHPGCSCG